MSKFSDWFLVKGYCHYANQKHWFGDDLKLFQHPIQIDKEHWVYGKGTVQIFAKKNATQYNKLVLHNVLYIPAAPANGLEFTSIFPRTEREQGKIYCYNLKDELVCVGLQSTCGYERVLLPETEDLRTLVGERNEFLHLYPTEKERALLYGEDQWYPLYLMNEEEQAALLQ